MRHSERLWIGRLRWRMRGAWQWPAFLGLTVLDGILLVALPPYEGTPPGVVGGVLLAGFANLLLIAVVAPLAGRWLRRRRPDLPRVIAADYAGTALVVVLSIMLLVAGLAHRPTVAAEHDDVVAVSAAVHGYVEREAPEWRAGLGAASALRLERNRYRACVPDAARRRWLCLLVNTARAPAGVKRDRSMEPNSAYRRF
jgi:hypothetical protein